MGKPKYSEYYYTIDTTSGDPKLVRYKWLDLDDDEKLYSENLVFKSYEDALAALDAASGWPSCD